MKKLLFLSIGTLGWLVQSTSAQVTVFTTADDFGQFGSPATANANYYSESGTVNGIGNTSSPGGASTAGSLQLTSPGGWNNWLSGSGFSGLTGAALSAIDPGAIPQYSAASGWGPGSLTAYSGTMTFDVCAVNLTDWHQFGISFNYDGCNWYQAWTTTSSDFTGADGNTWTHCVIPYTINATASLNYFQAAIAQNAGSTANEIFYIDNIQVAAVPEPGAFALLGLGGLGALIFRRRAGR
jgi:hypothetical protein